MSIGEKDGRTKRRKDRHIEQASSRHLILPSSHPPVLYLAPPAPHPDTPSITPIRAIVGRFSYPISRGAMERVLQERPFEFVASITPADVPKTWSGLSAERQEWFDSVKLRGCEYEHVNWDALLPLDEELLQNLRENEAVFMEMVARLEWKKSVPYPLRRHWYYRHVRFWNDYLERKKINLYISAWIPHEIPDIVIYHLCKFKKIPVLYFRDATERDTSFAEHTIEDSADCIVPRYKELQKEFAHVQNHEEIPLNAEYDRRFLVLMGKEGEKPAIEAVKFKTYGKRIRLMLMHQPLQFLRFGMRYLSSEGFLRIAEILKRRRIICARNAYYSAHAVEPDLTKPFIFMALHFQPEASTLPMGGIFIDQSLAAEMIHAHLPEGVLLYIKEHPRESAWISRDTEYYRRLTALKNVRLVPRDTDSFLLREHCKAVATITGSVGYEALFRGKPVLMFGHCYYQYAPGVFRIQTNADCVHAMNAIFKEGAKPDPKDLRIFLKAMEDTRVHGVFNPWTLKVSLLPEETHIKNNAQSIVSEIAKLEPMISAVR